MQNLKFKILLFTILFFSGFLLWQNVEAACTGSSPTWTSTPDYESVNSCITNATSGDTINVSAGTSTWTTEVTIPIDKTIHLVGAGGDLTKISFSDSAITSLSPDSTISGFWFYKTGANSTVMITVKNKGFRVHHNKMENSYNDNYKTNWAQCFVASGVNITIVPEGLVDNNTMINCKVEVWGAGNTTTKNAAWHAPSALGTERAVYFEDNTISRGVGAVSVLFDMYYGARAVLRYNSLNDTNGFMHAWQSSPANSRGVKSWEIYGNNWTLLSNINVMTTVNGGTGYIFNNYATAGMSGTLTMNVRDQRIEEGQCNGANSLDSNEFSNGYVCRDQLGTGPDSFNAGSSAPLGSNITKAPAYFWSNYRSTGATVNAVPTSSVTGYIVAERDYFDYDTTFDGTSGVGCGTLANLPETCTTGVGYWATDQDNCSDLTGYVGNSAQRTSGINTYIQGTLYKCTSTDTWEEYYTPYTYPHPLRSKESSDTTAPAAPSGLNVS